jgi:type II secretory pathway pseudopilin PulG
MALLPPLTNVNHQRGQSLVELMIAIGLCSILLPALITGLVSIQRGKPQQQERTSALSYLNQTEEQLRSLKENNWAGLNPLNIELHPVIIGTGWSLVPATDTIDGFTRKVVLSNVYRDNTNSIIDVGDSSQIDPSTILATITISWDLPRSSYVESKIYLSRHLSSLHSETTQSDFGVGTNIGTQTTNSIGGEVILGAGLAINTKWCEPSFSAQSVDLPEVPTAVSASPGNVYVSMGNTSSALASFAHVKVSTNPLTFTLNGRLNGSYRSTSVAGEPDWGYITTDLTNGKRLVIINLNQYSDPTNKIFKEEGSFSLSSSSNNNPATSISILGNRGYLTIGNYLYVLNLSDHTNPVQIGDRIQFSDNNLGFSPAKETNIRQIGSKTYAFIAIDGLYQYEMSIIDVTKETDTNQWKVVGQVDVDPNFCSTMQKTKGVYVNPAGTRAYISDANASDYKEFFVIDTTNKTNPFVIGGVSPHSCSGSYGGWDAAGDFSPQQSMVTLPLMNRAIVVGTGGTEQYVVLDVTNEASPFRCGGLTYSGGLNGVASTQEANGEVFAYVITTTRTQALKVIQGGPDIASGKYVATGTFESGTFDATSSVVFNRLLPLVSLPAGTDVKFQVAATDAISNSCTGVTFNYVGPDNSSASFFPSSGGIIPLSSSGNFKNPARCFRYKAFLTTSDTNSTPIIDSVTVNYSL